MKLLNQLKLCRVKNGDITQQDLADKVEVSRQTINSIEKDKFKPSIELALKLARALNIKVDELFYFDEDKKVDNE